jgi:hypothetical protein
MLPDDRTEARDRPARKGRGRRPVGDAMAAPILTRMLRESLAGPLDPLIRRWVLKLLRGDRVEPEERKGTRRCRRGSA